MHVYVLDRPELKSLPEDGVVSDGVTIDIILVPA